MKLGVGIPSKATADYTVPPRRTAWFVKRAEEYGFKGAWALEHLTRPTSYRTSFHDPLTTLATVAGETETIELGTSILILPMRHPVMVAKRAATIQHLSEGRLTLGLGQGYTEEEYDAVNVPFTERHRRFTEGIALLYRLLNQDEVTFDGQFYHVENFRLEPEITRAPKILVGGSGKEVDGEWKVARAIKKRIASVDGWIASSGASIEKTWPALADHLEGEGQDPNTKDRVGLQHIHLVPGDDEEVVKQKQRKVFKDFVTEKRGMEYVDDHLLTGTVEQIVDRLRKYETASFDQVILHPAAHEPGELDRQLDRWRDHLLPEFS